MFHSYAKLPEGNSVDASTVKVIYIRIIVIVIMTISIAIHHHHDKESPADCLFAVNRVMSTSALATDLGDPIKEKSKFVDYL